MPKHPRRHPLFPTVEEVKNNPSLAYSDHLPILVTVPLEQQDLNIVSLNTLGFSGHSGLHSEKKWESEEQVNERYTRIVKGLNNAKNKHKVDIIALQETSIDYLSPLLEKELGPDWAIIKCNGNLIAYSKQRFDLIENSVELKTSKISLSLQDKFNNYSQIDVHNMWDEYNPFPHMHEKEYRKLLNAAVNRVSVIVGDTNSRIAPLDNRPRNITTGVVPVFANDRNGAEPDVQITDYPDGGFYKDKHNKIHQLESKVLDYSSGDICEDKRTKEELESWPEYRMVLCLDESFQTNKIVNGKTIFDYEAEIKQKLGDKKIIVRMAADSFNRKALGIRFDLNSSAYEFIKEELCNEHGFQFRKIVSEKDYGATFDCVFAPIDKVALLHSKIYRFYNPVIETFYTAWLKESKAGYLISQPRMADTRAIDEALLSYHNKVINNADLNEQVNAVKNTLPLVEKWIENQDNAIFPHYSERYPAVKNLKNRLEVLLEVLNEQLSSDFSDKLDDILNSWKNNVSETIQRYKNITGINQMAKVFSDYSKYGDINYKLSIFYQIKAIAEQRLSGNLLSQFYCKSSLFGKGRNTTGVQAFYEEIANIDINKFFNRNNDPDLQQIDEPLIPPPSHKL